MQITIPEVEIKQAILDYIKSQVSIREDQNIEIDLRATRGAEGYQAIINITGRRDAPWAEDAKGEPERAADPAPTPVEPVAEAEPVKAAVKAVRSKAKLFSAPVSEIVSEAQEEAVTTAEVETPAEEPEVPVEASAEEEAEAEPTTSSKPSIFAGLSKPVNAKAATE